MKYILLLNLVIQSSFGFDLFLPKYSADSVDVIEYICRENPAKDFELLKDDIVLGKKRSSLWIASATFENITDKEATLLRDWAGGTHQRVDHLGCSSLRCVLDRLYGAIEKELLLEIYLRFNIISSHYQDKEAQRWSVKDLELILMALNNLPKHMLPLKKSFKLVRHLPSAQPFGFDNYIGSADRAGNIRFYNRWDGLSDSEKVYAVTHELAHTLGARLQLDFGKEWINLNRKEKSVSKYGTENQLEDFAETFTAYRFNPEWLKKRSIKKYEFMRDLVFLGVEYTQKSKCLNQGHFYQDIELKVDTNELYDSCMMQILGHDLGRRSLDEVLDCLEDNFETISVTTSFEILGPRKNKRKEMKDKLNYPLIDKRAAHVKHYWDLVEAFERKLL